MELIDTSDIGDEKLSGRYILRVELRWVVAVVYKVDISVEVAQKIHMPWRNGGNVVGMAQDAVASADIDIAINLAEWSCPPLAMGLVLCIRHLFVQVADIDKERDMVFARYVEGSAKGERGKGSAKDKVEDLVLHLPAQPARELPVAPIGEQRPKGIDDPLPRVVIVEGFLVDGVGMREVVGLELLGIDDRLIAAFH